MKTPTARQAAALNFMAQPKSTRKATIEQTRFLQRDTVFSLVRMGLLRTIPTNRHTYELTSAGREWLATRAA